VQIAPEDFSKHSVVAIQDNINAKYSNKVIQKIGLCICLYDLLWASEGLIGHGTGLVNVNGRSSCPISAYAKAEQAL
jgi:DNA-directed RNA polymerase III subunit RPC8